MQRDPARQLELVPIEYIGKKQTKTDTVTGSKVVWNGKGDVQLVPVATAQRLLVPTYADIWRLGPSAPRRQVAPPPAPPAAQQQASTTATAPPVATKPAQADESGVQLISAIGDLLGSADAALHIDDSGAPKVESLSAALGREVTVAERDAAWAEVMKNVEQQ